MKTIIEQIKNAKNVLIFPHKNADGDAVGSAFAMKEICNEFGKQAFVLFEEEMRENLKAAVYNTSNKPITAADLAIAVDTADLNRLGTRVETFLNISNRIAFDHHKTFNDFAKLNYCMPEKGSCGEVLLHFCRENKIEITKSIAHNLFLAISSDTGGLRQPNVSAQTFEDAAFLINHGADHIKINTFLFSRETLGHMTILPEVLHNMTIKNGVCTTYVTQAMLEAYGATEGDLDGITNYTIKTDTVKIGMLAREKDDGIVKVSMRSTDDIYDLAKFCAQFGGGGHSRAAGFEVPNENIIDVVEVVREEAVNYIKRVETAKQKVELDLESCKSLIVT